MKGRLVRLIGLVFVTATLGGCYGEVGFPGPVVAYPVFPGYGVRPHDEGHPYRHDNGRFHNDGPDRRRPPPRQYTDRYSHPMYSGLPGDARHYQGDRGRGRAMHGPRHERRQHEKQRYRQGGRRGNESQGQQRGGYRQGGGYQPQDGSGQRSYPPYGG